MVKRKLFLFILMLILFSLIFLPIDTAFAQENNNQTDFEFTNEEAIIINWEKFKTEPIDIEILNNTTNGLTLEIEFQNLRDENQNSIIPGNLFIISKSIDLPPAGSQFIHLSMKKDADPAIGKITGRIVVSNKQTGTVLRKELIFYIPIKAQDRIDPKLLTSKIVIKDDQITIIQIPYFTPDNSKELDLEEIEKTVGFLIGPDQDVLQVVRTECDNQLAKNIENLTLVCVGVSDIKKSGKYTGDIDLTPGKPQEKTTDIGAISLEIELVESSPLTASLIVKGKRDLSGNVEYDEIQIPFSINDAQMLPEFKDDVVGIVQSENNENLGIVRIKECKAQNESGIQNVCLSISELDQSGKYTGKIDITDNFDNSDSIELTVEIKDRIEYAIVACIIGMILGLTIIYISQTLINKFRLEDRKRTLQTKVQNAIINLDSEGFKCEYKLTAENQFCEFDKNYKAFLNAFRFKWVMTSEEYTNLIEILNNIEKEYQIFDMELENVLKNLATKVKEVLIITNDDPLNTKKKPENLIKKISKPLIGENKLAIGNLTAHINNFKELEDLSKRWLDSTNKTKLYEDWMKKLDKAKLLKNEREIIKHIKGKIFEIKQELYGIDSIQTLDEYRIENDILQTYQNLSRVGGIYSIWHELPGAEEEKQRTKLKVNLAAKDWFKDLIKDIGNFTENDITPFIEISKAKIASWFLFFLISIGSVLVGLQTLYFNQPFGSTKDYLNLMLLASGPTVITTGLVDAINLIFPKNKEVKELNKH